MDNDEIRKKSEARNPNKAPAARCLRHSDFGFLWSFVIRHSYLSASIGSTLAARQAGQCHSALGPAQGESATPLHAVGAAMGEER